MNNYNFPFQLHKQFKNYDFLFTYVFEVGPNHVYESILRTEHVFNQPAKGLGCSDVETIFATIHRIRNFKVTCVEYDRFPSVCMCVCV